jgi:hypothetical protein
MGQFLRASALVPRGFVVEEATSDSSALLIAVRPVATTSACPGCGARSERVHCQYCRSELCAVRPDGTASFDDLQAASDGRKRVNLVHYVFDLLYLGGEDLRQRPLRERKERLRGLIQVSSKLVRYGDHYVGDGEDFFESACHVNVEGSSRNGSMRLTYLATVGCGARPSAIAGRSSSSSATPTRRVRGRIWDRCFSPITPRMDG